MPMGEERLKRLIAHWIEHNEEHRARFEEEARGADGMGLKAVAEELRMAAESASMVTEHLRRALKMFDVEERPEESN
jgi:hypothetical protein